MNRLPEYKIMNPTGNITALVTEAVKPEERSSCAEAILSREPLAEQLGFLSFKGLPEGVDIALEMAGGEFCGNASMCAAVYLARIKNISEGAVNVKVSGALEPVPVELVREETGDYRCSVKMPAPLSVKDITFEDGARYPVVRFPGADHIIAVIDTWETPDWKFYTKKIRKYSAEMNSLCAGFMLYDPEKASLNPLVYVPAADTLFWEHSCASGTAALGAWLAEMKKGTVEELVSEPGGKLKVSVNAGGEIFLSGRVRM